MLVQANAVSLSAGLPHIEAGNQKVLYPSSAKAGSDLQVRVGAGSDISGALYDITTLVCFASS